MNASSQAANSTSGRSGPLIALVFLALIWGYNWVVMKAAMQYVGPMQFAVMRVALGAALMFALLAMLGVPLKPRYDVKTILLGLFQTAGFVGLISYAVAGGQAGKSSVLGYTMPFWVIVFGWPFLPDRLRGWQWPAAGLILIGLILVLELWSSGGGVASSLLALAAGISWAISVIVFKKMPVRDRNDLLSVTTWQMVWGLLPLVAAAALVPERPIEWSGAFVAALLYNGLGGMAIANFLWLYILQRLPATISGLNALTVPIVGVVAAWIQLGERPSVSAGIGMIAILLGLGLLTTAKRAAQP